MIKFANIVLSFIFPVAVISVNNFSSINYSDLYSVFKLLFIFSIFAFLPLLHNTFRKKNYDILVSFFIFLLVIIYLLKGDMIDFTYRQTILVYLACLFLSYIIVHFKILKNSFFIFLFLITFILSSVIIFFINHSSPQNIKHSNLSANEVFYSTNKEINIEGQNNFFFIIFDGFPRLSNLDKIGYDTKKFKQLFKKYNLFMFEDTTSNYLVTNMSVASTTNFSLIKHSDAFEIDLKNYNKFIQNSSLLNIFKSNEYSIHWFPNELPMSSCPKDKKINCVLAKHKIDFLDNEIVKFYFNLILIQPYWLEKVLLRYHAATKNNSKPIFNLDVVTEHIKNNNVEKKQFIYAHIMSPHPPYLLKENCDLQKFGLNYRGYDEKLFLKQIDCIYKQLSSFLEIVEKKMPYSNFFIHSDHGTAIIDPEISEGKESYENFILVNKKFICNERIVENKTNMTILKSLISCL